VRQQVRMQNLSPSPFLMPKAPPVFVAFPNFFPVS